MSDEPEEDERRSDLVGQLFALLTAKCEDGAAIAVEGQAHQLPGEQACELSERLFDLSQEIAVLAQAIVRLCTPPEGQTR